MRVTVLVILVLGAMAGAALAASPAAELVSEGRRAIDAGRFDDALSVLERAVAADANDPNALAWFGNAQVRKASKVSPMDAAGWVRRGFNTLDEAVERFPKAFIVYLVRGVTAANVPDMFHKGEVAIQDLRTVLAMRDRDPAAVPETVMAGVYLNLGRAYKKAGKVADARAMWEQGRRAHPAAPEIPAIDAELRRL